MLTTITDRRQSLQAFEALKRAIRIRGRGRGQLYKRVVGWRGGQDTVKLRWNQEEEIWSCLKPIENRFWCGFGLDDPGELDRLKIVVEINPPLEGVDLRNGGMFARNATGAIHLCHTGNIGGGADRVGKKAFWERYRGNSEAVHIPDRNKSISVVDLGPVISPMFVNRVAHFIHEVARIKQNISARMPIQAFPNGNGFIPEFSGRKSCYSPQKFIEATANHGLVVNALAVAIREAGFEIGNDQQRDMFVYGPYRGKSVTEQITLFEVKTDVSTTTIYQGVGQLMLNGLAQNSGTKLILVLPKKPNTETASALKAIGIDVLTYTWSRKKPVFSNLNRVLS